MACSDTSELKAKEAPDLLRQWQEWVNGSLPNDLTLLWAKGTKDWPWGMANKGASWSRGKSA